MSTDWSPPLMAPQHSRSCCWWTAKYNPPDEGTREPPHPATPEAREASSRTCSLWIVAVQSHHPSSCGRQGNVAEPAPRRAAPPCPAEMRPHTEPDMGRADHPQRTRPCAAGGGRLPRTTARALAARHRPRSPSKPPHLRRRAGPHPGWHSPTPARTASGKSTTTHDVRRIWIRVLESDAPLLAEQERVNRETIPVGARNTSDRALAALQAGYGKQPSIVGAPGHPHGRGKQTTSLAANDPSDVLWPVRGCALPRCRRVLANCLVYRRERLARSRTRSTSPASSRRRFPSTSPNIRICGAR